ncbi:MAG: cell wall-binding repeat-containing protein [Lachnospiraceae bacterium]|nr:cell wall-binding repeat-containing protein [Lachnospiraceae bacterium]
MKKMLSILTAIGLLFSSLPTGVTVMADEADPYEGYTKIYTIDDLRAIENDMSAKYVLMNDIDMTEATAPGGSHDSGSGWRPIGLDVANPDDGEGFSGEFDGNGFSIIGMHQTGTKYTQMESEKYAAGLFFKLCNGLSIHDLYLRDVDIHIIGTGDEEAGVGALAGGIDYYHYGESALGVKRVSAEGSIKAESCRATICHLAPVRCSECYSLLDIYVGEKSCIVGISGSEYGEEDCYFAGSITSSSTDRSCGYLVGNMVSRCYSIGMVSYTSESSCDRRPDYAYYPMQSYILKNSVSGGVNVNWSWSESELAERSAEDLIKPSTYKGWDFENTWIISPLSDYPYPQLRHHRQSIKTLDEKMSIERLGGQNRYATAAAIAAEAFPDGAEEIILVNGAKFPDALSASAYAGAKQCPLLITSLKSLKPEIQDLLTNTWNGRVRKVTIVGAGFEPAVYESLRNCGVSEIKDIAGADRFETAEKVFEAGLAEGYFNYDACVVATGAKAADALSVSSWTYKYHMPILLTKKSDRSLTERGRSIVSNFKKVYIVGSEEVVNDPTVNAMAATPGRVERLAGKNRYETSVKIAKRFAEPGEVNTLTFAAGGDNNFPDALGGAMLAGQLNSPIILVSVNEDNNKSACSYLSSAYGRNATNDLYLLGSSVVLSDYTGELMAAQLIERAS